ncbi:hypothetical protein [Paraflavitalea speifideaquila]|uniref:hypothetical protein n=1 Tax=Paraflavitalea speifideaquila TaxID=3076558 RepID=UPI0028E40922|nr:hypothetical protein [Paraflavitalea speifideiaquila]
MRTSNKILLGLFLTTIIVFASLFISVRVMYANGRIVQRDRINNWSDIHRIKEPIREVRLNGIGDIMIIPSDSTKLEIWKDNQHVKWRVENGVLYVEADSTLTRDGKIRHQIYGHIELSLPNVDSIQAVSSNVVVKIRLMLPGSNRYINSTCRIPNWLLSKAAVMKKPHFTIS